MLTLAGGNNDQGGDLRVQKEYLISIKVMYRYVQKYSRVHIKYPTLSRSVTYKIT